MNAPTSLEIAHPAAIGCENCLHMATHEKCNGCLSDNSTEHLPNGRSVYQFNYAHHEAGTQEQAMARLLELQRSGARSIVIGWQGEAEVNVRDSARVTYAHLCHVAEQCGYLISGGALDTKAAVILCHLPHGAFLLVYRAGRLARIARMFENKSVPIWDAQPAAGRTQGQS